MQAVLEQWGTWGWHVAAVGMAMAVMALAQGMVRSPRVKGWWGERRVRRWLAQGLRPAADYRCVHDVTLRLADGSTTQIDHVVLSPYGVFVLETKHYQGWIFGASHHTTWTQRIYQHRYSFQNPLHQNWRHVQALHQVLGVPLAQLHSVVVFAGRCVLKTAMPEHVTQGAGCVTFILQHDALVMSMQEVLRLEQQLLQQRLPPTRATTRAHVQQLAVRPSAGAPAVQRRVEPSAAAIVAKEKSARRAVLQPHVSQSNSPANAAQHDLERGLGAPPQPLPQGAMVQALAAESASSLPAAAPVVAMPPAVVLHPPPPLAPALAVPACPECGTDLVRRSLQDTQGQSRPFWRCSGFPQCRFLWVEPAQADVMKSL